MADREIAPSGRPFVEYAPTLMNHSSESAKLNHALEAQTAYFATRRPIRLQPADTPYIHRHFSEVSSACGLSDGELLCEWGSGLGRFSELALGRGRGRRLTGIELSPQLATECRERLSGREDVRIETGDVAGVLGRLSERFDLMLGFFVLHHLPELPAYFRAAAAALRPGGRMAFAEPNPFHPLFPVQILLTPGMRWRAEAGIYRLYPEAVRRAALDAGFERVEIARYGALPRSPYNLLARAGAERFVERLVPGVVKPFQTIVAWR